MHRYYVTKTPIKHRSDVEILGNPIVGFQTFDRPVLIESSNKSELNFLAYAMVDYERPLTPEEIADYALFTDSEYLFYHSHVFRVVNFLPYMDVWNINMKDGYIPFCRLKSEQPYPGGRQVDLNCLLAVKTSHAKEIMNVVSLTGKYNIHDLICFLANHLSENKKHKKEFERVLEILLELKNELN